MRFGALLPSSAAFPKFDGFLVFKASDVTVRTVAIQVKMGKGKCKKAVVPDWIESAHLIRGMASSACTLSRKWVEHSEQEIRELLGKSMAPLYPKDWPAEPKL